MNRSARFSFVRAAGAPCLAVAVLVAGLMAATGTQAQGTGIKRTPVLKADVSAPNAEAVVMRVELEPGVKAGRHTHPGDEISYVLEGEGDLLIDGEPPRRVKAGDAFVIPAGKIHDAHNAGSGTMRLVGVYVVEKGKPLATPAK